MVKKPAVKKPAVVKKTVAEYVDETLDDPVAEKARRQKLVEQADLEAAKELFGTDGAEVDLATYNPKSEKEFTKFGRLVATKFLTPVNQSAFYKEAVKSFNAFAVKHMTAAEVKEVEATLVAIRKEEGFLALYRGSLPTVLGALPYEGIKFGVYDFLRARLRAADGGGGSGGGPLSRACCGAAAGLIAHILTYPNDTLRRRLQLQGAGGKAPAYSGYFDCLSKLVRREGWPSLYRGLGITLVRTLPNTGIQFGVYEACKDYLRYVEYRNAR